MNKIIRNGILVILFIPIIPFVLLSHFIGKIAWWALDVPKWIDTNIIKVYAKHITIPINKKLKGGKK